MRYFVFFISSWIVQKLRVLAKRLAENLNLNYFDVKANSKDRILYINQPKFQINVTKKPNNFLTIRTSTAVHFGKISGKFGGATIFI